MRARLILIALLSAAIGAGAMIGVEEATAGGDGGAASAASTRAYLGVELGPSLLGQAGALVEYVAPGSPADDAGVTLGDVITSVAGRPVTSPATAAAAIRSQRPGATVAIGLDRLGASMTVSVTLGSQPATSP
jgi:S1-C subfamily serine protease